MKKTFNLLLILATIFAISCKGDPFEREKVTLLIEVTNRYFPEAKYIGKVTDTVSIVDLSATDFVPVQYGGLLHINTDQTNVQVRHLGGWIDTLMSIPDVVAYSHGYLDPEFYDVDTVYSIYDFPVSYALLHYVDKLTNVEYIDTAILNIDKWMRWVQTSEGIGYWSMGVVPIPVTSMYLDTIRAYLSLLSSTQSNEWYNEVYMNRFYGIKLNEDKYQFKLFDVLPYWTPDSGELIYHVNHLN